MTTLPLQLESKTTPRQELRFAKFVVFLNALVPAMLLLWDSAHGKTGANPVNYAIRTTGMLALIFLPLSLLVTPLRKLTGFAHLHHFRRMLGLYAFFYALAHFSIFFIYDRDLSISDTLSEMIKRTYLIIGSIGLLAMVPLAATSFNAVIRRMGPVRWRLLHKLAYVAAIAGVIHFYMLTKSDKRLPWVFIIIVGILLAYRIVQFAIDYLHTPAAAAASQAGRFSGTLRVARITQETPNVRTFRLTATDNRHPFHYQPGQYLTFALQIDGRKIYRSYTIASSPTCEGFCEVTIKRDENGRVSR
ncbi:MAG TPA: ferric reductase-like transmembrane domain-containing protein, partial [Phycisphaerae bacterium]|nr:ferric reductase-like transmembrane domain-containing protein [Phycisphaerae bacterium]